MKRKSSDVQGPVRFGEATRLDSAESLSVRSTLSPYAVPLGAQVSIGSDGISGLVRIEYLGDEPLTTRILSGGTRIEAGKRSLRPYQILIRGDQVMSEDEVARKAKHALTEYSKINVSEMDLLETIKEIKSFLP